MRILFLAIGSISLGLGILGAILPLMPATPFLLVAAACYARSSERMHRWLINHRWLGEPIQRFHDGRPLSPLQLSLILALLWVSIGISAALTEPLWLTILLLTIAASVTTFLLARQVRLRKREIEPTS